MKPCCIVIAGPSGAGKTTVANTLLKLDPTTSYSISATTRDKRIEGEDEYIHLTREDFEKMIQNGEILEYTDYEGNLYGTTKSEIERILSLGKSAVMVLDLNGIKSIKSAQMSCPVYAFYIYDDLNVIEKRLYDRDMAKPSVAALSAFVRRATRNCEDYMVIDNYLPYIDKFLCNESPELCASEILGMIGKVDPPFSKDECESIVKTLKLMAMGKPGRLN